LRNYVSNYYYIIFILFPFIPLILSVLGAIVGTVLALSMVMSGDLADQANSDKSGFCFVGCLANIQIKMKRS
jgi:hypothetical protein